MIYVITQGEYSDYSIHSIWSTKEKANAMLKILCLSWADAGRIEKYEVDAPAKEQAGVRVLIDFKTGEMIKQTKYHTYPYDDICITPAAFFQERSRIIREIPGVKNKEVIDTPTIEAIHFTLEQALKSARDKRAKILAEKSGI